MAGRECYHCKQWIDEGEAHDWLKEAYESCGVAATRSTRSTPALAAKQQPKKKSKKTSTRR